MTSEQLAFLAHFARTPDGQMLTQILRAKLTAVEAKLRTADGAEVHRLQGRAQQLDEVMTVIADAQTKLNRVANPPQRQVRAA